MGPSWLGCITSVTTLDRSLSNELFGFTGQIMQNSVLLFWGNINFWRKLTLKASNKYNSCWKLGSMCFAKLDFYYLEITGKCQILLDDVLHSGQRLYGIGFYIIIYT